MHLNYLAGVFIPEMLERGCPQPQPAGSV